MVKSPEGVMYKVYASGDMELYEPDNAGLV